MINPLPLKGLSIHQRNAHPNEYYLANLPAPHIKTRWSREEIVLLARAEARLRKEGFSGGINQNLVKCFPSRTLESMKGIRKQGKFTEVYNSICNEISYLSSSSSDSSESDSEILNPFVPLATPVDEFVNWVTPLIGAIESDHLCSDNILDLIIPGNPNDMICKAINEEFSGW